MRDVARLAGGVHPSTVSLALRNHPGISEATRKRVRAAARKLGYRPDPMLDAFNTHRLEVLPHKALPVIAFVADFESRGALEKSPQHSAIWAGARAAAESLHCQIEFFLVGKGQLTPERLHSILRARGIVSLVLAALRPFTHRLAFDWNDYSAIKIESSHLEVPLDSVSSDHRLSSRLACRQLHALGYARVGLAISAASDGHPADLSRAGYLLEQSRKLAGSAASPLELEAGTVPDVVARWIQQHRIEAVVSNRVDLPEQLAQAGLRVPQQIAFAHLDVARDTNDLAGIVTDHYRVGAQAVEQVVSLMRSNQRGLPSTASHTCVPVSWKHGASAPARNGAMLLASAETEPMGVNSL